jgi:hypothetical protein
MPHLCAVYGCGHNSTRDSGVFRFFRFPSIIQNQGEQTLELCTERRRVWLNNVGRADYDLTDQKLKSTRVRGDHFISGKYNLLEY